LGAAAAVPVVLTIQAPPVAAETTPPDRRDADPPGDEGSFCSTVMLTPEELDAGVISTVNCYPTMDESLRAIGVDVPAAEVLRAAQSDVALNADVVAIHYDDKGEAMSVGGSTCGGGGVSFGVGHAWNDRIYSTQPKHCSSIKHWVDANYGGVSQAVTPSRQDEILGLNGTLARNVSSIRYY
jgi:hypothetical protein